MTESEVAVKKGLEVKVMQITPKIAKKWLEKNMNFRNVRASAVQRYSRDMSAGKWELNAETIKFDREGHLIDGQNRLEACVLADVPFRSLVAFEVETHKGIDEGAVRTVVEEFKHRGFKNAPQLAIASLLVKHYEMNALDRKGAYGLGAVSSAELVEVLLRHKKLPDFVESCFGHTALVPSAPVAAVLYIGGLGNLDHPLVVKMINGLDTGSNLNRGNPILVLRDFWAWLKMQQHRPPSRTVRAHIVLAWNALAEKRTITKKDLAWFESGPRKQDFPRIVIAK